MSRRWGERGGKGGEGAINRGCGSSTIISDALIPTGASSSGATTLDGAPTTPAFSGPRRLEALTSGGGSPPLRLDRFSAAGLGGPFGRSLQRCAIFEFLPEVPRHQR